MSFRLLANNFMASMSAGVLRNTTNIQQKNQELVSVLTISNICCRYTSCAGRGQIQKKCSETQLWQNVCPGKRINIRVINGRRILRGLTSLQDHCLWDLRAFQGGLDGLAWQRDINFLSNRDLSETNEECLGSFRSLWSSNGPGGGEGYDYEHHLKISTRLMIYGMDSKFLRLEELSRDRQESAQY